METGTDRHTPERRGAVRYRAVLDGSACALLGDRVKPMKNVEDPLPLMTTSLEIGNRELQHVERSVQERATLLSSAHPSLRFQDVTPQELETLAGSTAVFLARQGSLVFQEATPGRWMALVVVGGVDVLKLDRSGGLRLVTTIGPGQFLGELTFLDGHRQSATAVASTDTLLLVLTRAAFDRLLEETPALVVKLLPDPIRLLVLRLRKTDAIG